MKILVTGGAGFIGSHLVEALLQDGNEVRVLDNFSTGRKENLEDLSGKFELIEGDVRDESLVEQAVGLVEAVLHQAALPSIPRSFSDPITTTEVNSAGTLSLLEAARKSGVKLFVLASSSSVYGESDAESKNEGLPPSPLSPYAASKLSGEHYCRLYHKIYGLTTLGLRYFNVFGPRQDSASEYAAVIPRFITAVLKGGEPVVYGDGRQTRDFTYVANVVQANLKALSAPPGSGGEVFNVACGEETSLLSLLGLLSDFSGKAVSPRFEPPRPGDVRHSRADISKAGRILGYRPSVGFPEGLEKTFEYFKINGRKDAQNTQE